MAADPILPTVHNDEHAMSRVAGGKVHDANARASRDLESDGNLVAQGALSKVAHVAAISSPLIALPCPVQNIGPAIARPVTSNPLSRHVSMHRAPARDNVSPVSGTSSSHSILPSAG